MKRVMSVGLVVVLALAMGMEAPQTQARVAVPQPLMDGTAAGGEVSVIVGVGARFVPEGNLPGPAAVADQRASIAEAVDGTMARAAAVGVQVGRQVRQRFPTSPRRVNRAQLEALATTAGVASINEDGLRKPSLDSASAMVNAPPAWAAGHTGAGWTVAVLDTGVETTHTFLGGRVTREACYSDSNGARRRHVGVPRRRRIRRSDPAPARPARRRSTGATTARTSPASSPAPTGRAARTAWRLAPRVMAVQVFTRFDGAAGCGAGNPSPCIGAFDSDIIRGLERVLAEAGPGNVNRIAAVNMSLGGELLLSEAGCDARQRRHQGRHRQPAFGRRRLGHRLGQRRRRRCAISAPACISTAVAVGATTKGVCPGAPLCPAGAVRPGSPTCPSSATHSAAVDLLAPGVGINSSVLEQRFRLQDGTSMATPHVAGAWAMLKQAVPRPRSPAVLAAFVGHRHADHRAVHRARAPADQRQRRAARPHWRPARSGRRPGAPTGFAATVSGNHVNMTWAPGAGSPATGYTLVARLAPAAAPIVTLPLGNVTAFAVVAPNGVFYLSVVATNASGASPESNQVQITVPSLPTASGPTHWPDGQRLRQHRGVHVRRAGEWRRGGQLRPPRRVDPGLRGAGGVAAPCADADLGGHPRRAAGHLVRPRGRAECRRRERCRPTRCRSPSPGRRRPVRRR